MLDQIPLCVVEHHIASKLPLTSILNLRRVSKFLSQLKCDTIEHWKSIFERKLFNFGIGIAMEMEDHELVKILEPKVTEWSSAIAAASKMNNEKLVKYLVENKPHWSWVEACYLAARNGNLDILQYFCNGRKFCTTYWHSRYLMYNAGRGGHKHVVDYLMQQGFLKESLTYALNGAAYVGNKELFQYIVSIGGIPLGSTLRCAARGAKWDFIHLILGMGVTDYKDGCLGAVEGEHKDVENFFLKLGSCEQKEEIRQVRQVANEGAWKHWRSQLKDFW